MEKSYQTEVATYADGTTYTIYTIYAESTTQKPATMTHGSRFIELDTGKVYFYSEDSAQWIEW